MFVGGNISDLGVIDGTSMWESFVNIKKSPRNLMLHNIDDITGFSAIRDEQFKYIKGKYYSYLYS